MNFKLWVKYTVLFIILLFLSVHLFNDENIKYYKYILWIGLGWVEGSFVTWFIINRLNKNDREE